jgi:hypothetical protein
VNVALGGTTAKIDQIFITALTASKYAKRALRDNWGNVRVPQLGMLDAPGGGGNTTAAWLPVPHITLPEAYSSLIGIPIVGLPPNLAANFTIETSYMALACSPWSSYRRYLDWAKNASSVWNVTGSSPNEIGGVRLLIWQDSCPQNQQQQQRHHRLSFPDACRLLSLPLSS